MSGLVCSEQGSPLGPSIEFRAVHETIRNILHRNHVTVVEDCMHPKTMVLTSGQQCTALKSTEENPAGSSSHLHMNE